MDVSRHAMLHCFPFTVPLNAVLPDEAIQAANSAAFLIREVCQTAETFESVVKTLIATPLATDCLLLVAGTKRGEMVVIECTPSRHAIRTTKNDFLIVTHDYRVLDCHGADASGDIYDTTCRRFDGTARCLGSRIPATFDECFNVLDKENVKMRITVQQMVMCAATGKLKVRTA